ncbi:hypothetical protein NDU88_004951, partial [Pleurodeles waltl]
GCALISLDAHSDALFSFHAGTAVHLFPALGRVSSSGCGVFRCPGHSVWISC